MSAPGHAGLLAEGWLRQTTIAEPRLSELAENYRALGYEVKILRDGVMDGCGVCYAGGGAPGTVGTLYLRSGSSEAGVDDGALWP